MTVDFNGVCNANLQNSKFLGPLPEAFSVKIAQPDAEIKALIMVTRRDGSVHRAALHGQPNGQEDKNLLDRKPVRGGAKWDGAVLILESWNPGILESWVPLGSREMHVRDCWSLSDDRQTLIMEHRDDDLAGPLAILKRTEMIFG